MPIFHCNINESTQVSAKPSVYKKIHVVMLNNDQQKFYIYLSEKQIFTSYLAIAVTSDHPQETKLGASFARQMWSYYYRTKAG